MKSERNQPLPISVYFHGGGWYYSIQKHFKVERRYPKILCHRAKRWRPPSPYFSKQAYKLESLGRVPIATHPDHIPTEYVDKYRLFKDYVNAPMNIARSMIEFFNSVGASPQDPEFFIINSANFDRFPATYLAVCNVDPIRDNGLIIHNALNKALGCPTPNGTFLGDVIDGINFAVSS
ncbi:hypothetical protein N7490_002135 [Penicillium lividum]|nr:hypothetical protein N7490_002135 [Penicillium lividum]